jgi:hypothetical protein
MVRNTAWIYALFKPIHQRFQEQLDRVSQR